MDASGRGDNRTQEGVTLKTARGDIDGVGEDEVTVTTAAYKETVRPSESTVMMMFT